MFSLVYLCMAHRSKPDSEQLGFLSYQIDRLSKHIENTEYRRHLSKTVKILQELRLYSKYRWFSLEDEMERVKNKKEHFEVSKPLTIRGVSSKYSRRGTVFVMNSQIVPLADDVQSATVHFNRADVKQVSELLKTTQNFVSAVGHEATAHALTALIGIEVPFRRIAVEVRPGDVLILFKLKGRLPEGRVITDPAELETIGYEFWIAKVS